MKVTVKWGKASFDVEVDPSLPGAVFKTQMFTLTGVPPDRQKFTGIKNPPLKDDADMSTYGLKEGSKLMMLGTPDVVSVEPTTQVVFVEDLPEAAQAKAAMKNFSAGLENLGNTCYMNSTLQCLYSVPELRAALAAYSASPVAQHTQFDGPYRLTAATRDLFAEIGRSGASVTPLRFLTTLRQVFPQFASQGRNGAYMQQDAEECWTGIMETLRQQLTGTQDRAADGAGGAGAAGAHPVVKELFGMDLATVLKSPETGEERSEQRTEFSFKCNITSSVNHVMDGFRLALDMTREASSEAAGRTVVFTGRSCLTRLPAYLTVQLVRFDYRQDTRQRCKIQKEVAFSPSLDVYEFAGDALKASLDGARRRKQAADDKKVEQKNTGAAAAAADGAAGSGDVVMAEGEPGAPPSPTGFYDLRALITHKGRDADSGHYVAYVKQGDGSWMEFDDEKPIPRSEDDILRLRGGLGDHPCAYLMLYKSVLA